MTVLVGNEEIPFILHETHLSSASSYFRAALEPGRFKEGLERLVRLPEVEEDTFELFATWLYSGHLAQLPETVEEEANSGEALTYQQSCDKKLASDIQATADRESQQEKNMSLFAFAETYLVDQLKNQVGDYLVEYATRENFHPHDGVVEIVYSHTRKGSRFRRLLRDWYVWEYDSDGWSEDWQKEWLASMPEFAADLVEGLAEARRCPNMWNPIRSGSGLYDHDDGEDVDAKSPPPEKQKRSDPVPHIGRPSQKSAKIKFWRQPEDIHDSLAMSQLGEYDVET